MCRQIYEGLFPVQVYARVAWGMHEEVLFASERTYLRGATRQRREEFISVRACARDALRCLGLSRPPLIAHAIRGLQWPEGTTGSLTHTGQYRAAVVASSQDVTGIGIDAESALPLPEGLRDRILTQNTSPGKFSVGQDHFQCERSRLQGLCSSDRSLPGFPRLRVNYRPAGKRPTPH